MTKIHSAWAAIRASVSLCLVALLGIALTPAAGAQIRFSDASGILDFKDVFVESWGAAWGDLNSDGYPDFYVGNHRDYGQMQVYNTGQKRFKRKNSADVDGIWSTGFPHFDDHGASWADLDNDGDLDLLLSEARGESRWMRNTGGELRTAVIDGIDGAFAWALENGGRNLVADFTGKYLWTVLTDLNHAGRLDRLQIDNDAHFPRSVDFQGAGNNVQLPSVNPVIDMIPGDFDGDLKNDFILVSGRDRPNGAYRVNANTIETSFNLTNSSNNQELTIRTAGSLTLHDITDDAWRGSGNDYENVRIGDSGYAPNGPTFTLNVASSANWGVSSSSSARRLYVGYDRGEGAWKLRFNSEGNFEYLHFYMTTDAPITSFSQPSNNVADNPLHPRLYLNTGAGFRNAGFGVGLNRVLCGSGVAGDFDNDMDLDVYMACRNGGGNLPNVLFENQGDGTFIQRFGHGAEGGVGGALFSRVGMADSAVVADYDIDGVLDILVTNGMHMRPLHTGGPKQLFKGVANGNHWLLFDLVGTRSNRDGIGAKIYVTTPDGQVQYREQNGGYHRWSQNHMRVHVGLGANTEADVRVEWPSGQVDQYRTLQSDKVYWLDEAGLARVRFDRQNTDTDGDGLLDSGDIDDDNDGLTDSAERSSGINRSSGTLTTPGGGGSRTHTIDLSGSGVLVGQRVSIGSINAEGDLNNNSEYFRIEFNDGEFVTGTLSTGLSCTGQLEPVSPAVSPQLTVVDLGGGTPGLTLRITTSSAVNTTGSCAGLAVTMRITGAGAFGNDADGDGVVNSVDLDSDNDGVADVVEAGLADADGNFLVDQIFQDQGSVTSAPDSDGDGLPDFVDLESRNASNDRTDFDIDRAGLGNKDSNGDGQLNGSDSNGGRDRDRDGIDDLIDGDPSVHGGGSDGGPVQAMELCDEPQFDAANEPGLYLWQECSQSGSRVLQVRAVGGGLPFDRYVGRLDADAVLSATGISLENSDFVDSTSGDGRIDFQLSVVGRGVDGFVTRLPQDVSSCLRVTELPAGAQVFIGAGRTAVVPPFNLEDLGQCR